MEIIEALRFGRLDAIVASTVEFDNLPRRPRVFGRSCDDDWEELISADSGSTLMVDMELLRGFLGLGDSVLPVLLLLKADCCEVATT